MNSYIAVDIGNSRIKLRNGNEYSAFACDDEIKDQLSSYLNINTDTINKIIYSSVNPAIEGIFLQICSTALKASVINASEVLEKQSLIKFNNISGIGTDRICGLLGAMKQSRPPLITIDCGTAITINALNEDGKCLGGAILPGIYTQLWSLTNRTAGLNNGSIILNPSTTGKSTEEAISSGLLYGISGAIKEIVLRIIAKHFDDKPVPIYITGGTAELLMPIIDSSIRVIYCPWLVLDGLYYLAEMTIE